MRTTLGPVLGHLALAGAGYGVLWLTGQLRSVSPTRLVAALGLAYMAGVATVVTLLIVLNVAGVGLSLPLVAAVCVVVAAPALGLLRPSAWSIRRPELGALRRFGAERWFAVAVVVGLAGIAVTGARALAFAPLGDFDAWLIWTRRAVLLFYDPHIPDAFVRTQVESGGHWDYPLLYSMLQALQFRAAGTVVQERAHLVSWILLFGFAWAAAFLVRRVTRPAVWAAVLGAVVLLDIPQVVTGLADTPMACFLALGALAVGLWVESGRPSDLAIGAVLLAGAAGTKTEGLMGAVVVLGVAVVVQGASRDLRRAALAVAAGLGLALVAVLPWQLWLAAHDVRATTPLSQALSPAYLLDHSDRVWPSVQALYSVLAGLGLAQAVIPIAIALVVVRIRSLPRVSAYWLAVVLGYFAALVWAYWATALDLPFLIGTSVVRIHIGVELLAAVAVLHLTGARAADADVPPEPVVARAREEVRRPTEQLA